MDLFERLTDLAIPFVRTDHPPVYTCEEAMKWVPEMPGADTKNLFLRDKKGRRHFLVVVGYDKRVDIKALSGVLGVGNLSFGSSERLMRHLGIEPGSVSLLAVVNDSAGAVEVVADRALWEAASLRCHPLVNTSTLAIARPDLERLLATTGHTVRVVDVPEIPTE